MAITNFTGDANQKTYEEIICSEELTGGIHSELISLSVLNIFLSITAFLGNTLIVVALHKESCLHPPSKFLFRSLATTDFCVGIIAQPALVTIWMSAVNDRWNICRYAVAASFITSYMLCLVSLLTSTAISVDRLLALLLKLRYRQVVTLERTHVAVFAFWLVSTAASTMRFWNYLILDCYFYGVTTLCLVTSIYSYTKIFLTLRHHQIQVQANFQAEQRSQTIPLNMARYKKAVSSAMWLQLTLVVCYLPYAVVSSFSTTQSSSLFLASQFSATLVLLKSSINPILYCLKIGEVRQAMKDTIRQLLWSQN